MQVVETKNEGLLREYTITVLASEIAEKVDFRLEDLRKTANIPGFRPGKVPTALLKQRYGKNVMGEVLEQAVSESSRQAIEDNTLRPAMQPSIEITKFEDGEVEVAWTVLAEHVGAFCDTWERADQPPDLANHVPAQPTLLRRLALIELVKIDLEHRWQRQLQPSG